MKLQMLIGAILVMTPVMVIGVLLYKLDRSFFKDIGAAIIFLLLVGMFVLGICLLGGRITLN